MFSVSYTVQANERTLPETISSEDLKPNLPQPYVVKKGDTLWDIANYFFKNPHKWLKIWEKNLYITNPDLIYPGNNIWFKPEKKKQKTLTLSIVRAQPTIINKPVERLEKKMDTSLLVTALSRQSFISPDALDGVGYLLDSEDERINYATNDSVYIKMLKPAKVGELFDVFRSSDVIYDPDTGEPVGALVKHLGQIEITSHSGGIYRGMITKNFEEISRADRLKPADKVTTKIEPHFPEKKLHGKVLYIRNDAAEAGQNQIIAINLGLGQELKAGTILSVHRAGRTIIDQLTGEETLLPEEKIGEIMVLVAHQHASLALVLHSSYSINIGDAIHSKAER
ncbi:MAG: LysM peptidoglycan-binding domain-containing protein [Mariprofundaceae bacterium]|nr:LysM peptidoglycan-binding domain-containing protein [Mariprofundaceae bacterium]